MSNAKTSLCTRHIMRPLRLPSTAFPACDPRDTGRATPPRIPVKRLASCCLCGTSTRSASPNIRTNGATLGSLSLPPVVSLLDSFTQQITPLGVPIANRSNSQLPISNSHRLVNRASLTRRRTRFPSLGLSRTGP